MMYHLILNPSKNQMSQYFNNLILKNIFLKNREKRYFSPEYLRDRKFVVEKAHIPPLLNIKYTGMRYMASLWGYIIM